MKKNSFFRRQFLTLLALAVVPLILTLSTTLSLVKDEIIQQTTSKLETVADLKTQEVNHWLDQGREVVLLVSTLTEIKEHLPDFYEYNNYQTIEIHPDLIATLDNIVDIFPTVQSISILHPKNGSVMISTDGTLLGRSREFEDYFIEGKKGLYVSSVAYSVGRETPILALGAPIYGENDQVVAVAAVEMNLTDLEVAMSQQSSLGETGRAYLIEKFGFHVTLSRNAPEGTLSRIVESEGALQALQNNNGSGTYLDQYGVQVLGVYRWLPEPQMGLMVEIDEAEIIAQYTQIAIAISAAQLVLLTLFIFSARTVARWLVSPLSRIAQAARLLQEGKLEQRAPTGGPEEIHQLATTFNEMAESLQQSHESLEEKVEIRTLALRQAEARLENIVQAAPDAIISIDKDQNVIMFNKAAEQMLDYDRKNVIGKHISLFIPSAFHRSHESYIQHFAKDNGLPRQMNIGRTVFALRSSGEEFPIEASISSVFVGEQQIMTVILRDITEREEADRKIKNSLLEKETLLQEIHHRVKNNLQIISSLLYLQGKRIDDVYINQKFEESRSRIMSMALVHEKLYQADDLARIDLGEYLQDLAEDVFSSYREDSTGVKLTFDLENIWVNIETAMPCGLIVNELVTNSLKYAFPKKQKGKVEIGLHREEGGGLVLIFGDDGVGLPDDFDPVDTDSLGLSLVNNLVKQLDGTLSVDQNNGVNYTIKFSKSRDSNKTT